MTAGGLPRRRFLAASAVSGLAGLAPFVPALAASGGDPGEEWGGAFAAALGRNPMLLGWKTPPDRLDTGSLAVTGAWPAGLKGRFFRNGPSIHDRFGRRCRHWFDGDGMIQEFAIDGGRIAHRGRTIRTPKLDREDAAGKRLYNGYGTHLESAAPVRGPDGLNAANISVLHHGGELLALWEGGSATRLDEATLAASGFKSWSPQLAGVPFSAHPKVDPDGTLWNIGCALLPRPALVLYHIDRAGRLAKAALVDAGPIGLIHDFVVTHKSLVILIQPFLFDPGRAERTSILDAHVWDPQAETRVLVVDKEDFNRRRWHALPACFGFHYGNAWEEADGTIRLDHCLAGDPGILTETLRYVMKGEFRPSAPLRYAQIVLPPKGDGRIESRAEEAEFAKVAPAVVGRRHRFVYTLGAPDKPEGWHFRTVVKRDLERGTAERFDYGPGKIPEEHIFVPKPGGRSEDDGWLIGTVLDWKKGVSGLSAFDAQAVSAGPVAQAWLPYPLPLGFHGAFVGG
ncbi:MAG: carotenoid oxygenase [Rhodospirillaceae bacterium]|nr:carotenoid oxygenase [Rhodospirillaceae bacterium]MYI48886.1 carotenoid oxygenase [Rhodospirillaceae bacterium]